MIIYLRLAVIGEPRPRLWEVGDTDRRQHPVPHVGSSVMLLQKSRRVIDVIFDYAANSVVVELQS